MHKLYFWGDVQNYSSSKHGAQRDVEQWVRHLASQCCLGGKLNLFNQVSACFFFSSGVFCSECVKIAVEHTDMKYWSPEEKDM